MTGDGHDLIHQQLDNLKGAFNEYRKDTSEKLNQLGEKIDDRHNKLSDKVDEINKVIREQPQECSTRFINLRVALFLFALAFAAVGSVWAFVLNGG